MLHLKSNAPQLKTSMYYKKLWVLTGIKAPLAIRLSLQEWERRRRLSHSNPHQDNFIDSYLNTYLKNHYNAAQLSLFKGLNPKWIMQYRTSRSRLLYGNARRMLRSLLQICPPDMELVTETYGLWLIALIYCVRVSLNWSCHLAVNITKTEILSGRA